MNYLVINTLRNIQNLVNNHRGNWKINIDPSFGEVLCKSSIKYYSPKQEFMAKSKGNPSEIRCAKQQP